ncbi:hypothetical protein DL93DRAFT_2092145, partial [Clavulina sp. PMI_390]
MPYLPAKPVLFIYFPTPHAHCNPQRLEADRLQIVISAPKVCLTLDSHPPNLLHLFMSLVIAIMIHVAAPPIRSSLHVYCTFPRCRMYCT